MFASPRTRLWVECASLGTLVPEKPIGAAGHTILIVVESLDSQVKQVSKELPMGRYRVETGHLNAFHTLDML